ncbi:MAG: DUF4136 domain-containing protein [Ferruginibacter sp.]
MKHRSIKWVAATAVTLVILFTGCAGNAHIEKDKSADFSKYHTYAWVEKPEEKATKKNRRNELTEANMRNSVNEQLQKIGWKEAGENPDIMINYELLVERNQKEQKDPVYSQSYTRSYYNRYTGKVNTFYYPGQFVGYDSYSTTVKEGTVTITMIDNRTDKTVWQGWTTSELMSSKITGKEIDQSVKTIFRKFDAGK